MSYAGSIMADREALRKAVLRSGGGYSERVQTLLKDEGFRTGWCQIRGRELIVYIGDPDRRRDRDRAGHLISAYGGRSYPSTNGRGETSLFWTWEAPLEPIDRAVYVVMHGGSSANPGEVFADLREAQERTDPDTDWVEITLAHGERQWMKGQGGSEERATIYEREVQRASS